MAAKKIPSKIYEIEAHLAKVTCLDLGVTGRVLVTGSQDRNVNLWAIGNTQCFMSLSGHNSAIECVKFAYADDFVYSADDGGVIKRWDLNASVEGHTSFYGHMKKVRTLDFHPFGEYVVSGSNDTSICLWDVKNSNSCIKKYRGHIADVSSVRFSPDGSWIASAGTEGSVIVWDIRMSKQIIEFNDITVPVTCIQFHPFDFLLAAGRSDGTVDLYDLESHKLISHTKVNSYCSTPVICITFSENGSCLFAGTKEGVAVIGWEPDREFDYIESTWNYMADMKVTNKRLMCGTYDNSIVAIFSLNLDQVTPFYNPTSFTHNQSNRKSFSRTTGKVRVSIGNKSTSKSTSQPNKLGSAASRQSQQIQSQQVVNKTNGNSIYSNYDSILNNDGGLSSPNLSIEMINEEDDELVLSKNHMSDKTFEYKSLTSTQRIDSTITTDSPTSTYYNDILGNDNLEDTVFADNTIVFTDTENEPHYYDDNTLEYYQLKHNLVHDKEDFPINNAQQPDYVPKVLTSASSVQSQSHISKIQPVRQRRTSQPSINNHNNIQNNNINSKNHHNNTQQNNLVNRKITTSMSSIDLNKLDDNNYNFKKPLSRGSSPIRINNFGGNNKIRKSESTLQLNRENTIKNSSKNLQVKIYTKPIRSQTSLDFKAPERATTPRIMNYIGVTSNENQEIQMISSYHETVYTALCNRHAILVIVQNYSKGHDLIGAIRNAIKMNDRNVLVDLLGSLLEKSTDWTLDMCVILLPEIYELLQSQFKFHYTRACDTLRVILKSFLPIIQANTNPWSSGCTLGVDITREERQRKCMECKQWLLRIRTLPESNGASLSQLQNLIVDL